LNRAKLFEVQPEQVGNVEVLAFGGAYTFEVDIRNTIRYFQLAITCEAVIDTDPAEGVSFSGTGTFEIFIERGFQQCIGWSIAHTRHFDGRQIRVITDAARKVNVDPGI